MELENKLENNINNELEKDILNKEIIEIASNKVKMKEMGEKDRNTPRISNTT